MKKFIIYRCPDNCTCHKKLKEHELIAVFEGSDFFNLDDDLDEVIKSDLQSLAPDMFFDGKIDICHLTEEPHSRKYKYSFDGVFIPSNASASKNILRQYGVVEEQI